VALCDSGRLPHINLLFVSEVVIVNNDYMLLSIAVIRTDSCPVLQSTVVNGRGDGRPHIVNLWSSITERHPISARDIMSLCWRSYFRKSHFTPLPPLLTIRPKSIQIVLKWPGWVGSNTNPRHIPCTVHDMITYLMNTLTKADE